MWMLLELLIIIGCCAVGLRRLDTAKVFGIGMAGFLLCFALTKGNPVGLLVSGGGWLILDGMLVVCALAANASLLLRRRRQPRCN